MTPLGFFCLTQEVHRYDTFRVSMLHTGSTQVRHGTTPLGFFCLMQELHRYDTFRVSLLHTGKYTGTTPLGFLCLTQEVHGSTQVRHL